MTVTIIFSFTSKYKIFIHCSSSTPNRSWFNQIQSSNTTCWWKLSNKKIKKKKNFVCVYIFDRNFYVLLWKFIQCDVHHCVRTRSGKVVQFFVLKNKKIINLEIVDQKKKLKYLTLDIYTFCSWRIYIYKCAFVELYIEKPTVEFIYLKKKKLYLTVSCWLFYLIFIFQIYILADLLLTVQRHSTIGIR